MKGYWNAPELTAETIRDGWLYTGDMGRLDEDGYLTILDRKKDLIIRGGFNVFPRDVEEALLEHPAIATACVVGRPGRGARRGGRRLRDAGRGDRAGRARRVRQGSGSAATSIRARSTCSTRYRSTPIGKVDRKALREQLTDRRKNEMTTTLTIERARAGRRARARHELVARHHAGAGQHRSPRRPATTSGSTSIPERAADGPVRRHGRARLPDARRCCPMLLSEVVSVSDAVMGVNYGTEKVRFTSPVPVGSRVRLHAKLLEDAAARAERDLERRRRGRDRGQGEAGARRRGRLHGRGSTRCLKPSSSPRRGRRSAARARARSSTRVPTTSSRSRSTRR